MITLHFLSKSRRRRSDYAVKAEIVLYEDSNTAITKFNDFAEASAETQLDNAAIDLLIVFAS